MRWRILISIGRWQLLAGRCPQCGWPKLAVVRDGVMHELPNRGLDMTSPGGTKPTSVNMEHQQ
jgi:hypothetical protein